MAAPIETYKNPPPERFGVPTSASEVVAIFIGSGDFTGAPKMGWHIARAFKHLGFEVIAIVGRRPADGTSVIDRLRADNIIVLEEVGFERLWSFPLANRCAARLRAIDPVLVVSVVQNDFKIAAMVARSLGTPLVVMGQSLTTFYGWSVMRRLKARMFGILARRYARLVVCPSHGVANQFRQVHRVDPRNLIVIPNGIEVEDFAQTHNTCPSSLGDERPLEILNVGRLDLQKGQDILLDAVSLLPVALRNRLKVLFVGRSTMGSKASTSFLEGLRRNVNRSGLGLSVSFLGWRDDVPKILGRCDIYVHSARWEGLPLSVLEAMAAGLPTIYTDCSGAFEGFVNGVHGFMVKAGDPSSLCGALMQMLALTPQERFAMGQNARELARSNYDISALGQRFVESCVGVIARDRSLS
jgi:glycosyltransferase involved in cell wall biosynthesis